MLPGFCLVLLLLSAAAAQDSNVRTKYYFKEEFHMLRRTGMPEGTPPQCWCAAAARTCQEMFTYYVVKLRSAAAVAHLARWGNVSGFFIARDFAGLEKLKTQRYSGKSTFSEYDMYGCDCSQCNQGGTQVKSGECLLIGLPGCMTPLQHGENCTPGCIGGFGKPSAPTMSCNRGVLSQPTSWCHSSPPTMPAKAMTLIDADPLPGFITGFLEIDLPLRPWRLNATSVTVYPGTGGTPVGPPLLHRALLWNHEGPLHYWLERISLPSSVTSLLAVFSNANGESTPLATVMPADLLVDPQQPKVQEPFSLQILGSSPGAWTGLHLSSNGSCVAGGEGIMPGEDGRFQVPWSGRYSLCACHGACGTAVPIGQVMVTGVVSAITGEGGRELLPVVGSSFILELHGEGIGPGHVIRAVPASGNCGAGVAEAKGVSGLGMLATSTSPDGALRWQVVGHESGTYRVCLSMDLCEKDGAPCRELRRASEVSAGTFTVRPCEAPCETCYGHPQVCTSCRDRSFVPQNGTCWPAARWCAEGASNCTEVDMLVTSVVGADMLPRQLVEEFQCASEAVGGCRDCVMASSCQCQGLVKFGAGDTWSHWRSVSGTVACSAANFGQDPLPGQPKVCICRPSDTQPLSSLAQQNTSMGVDPYCECAVKGIRRDDVTNLNPFYDPVCSEEMPDCRVDTTVPRVTEPVSVAVLGPNAVLIADRSHYNTNSVPQRLLAPADIPKGAVFLMDLVTGNIRYACPSCCSKHLYEPRSVRVAPSGAFWLIADSRNHRIRRVDARTLEMTDLAGKGSQRCMNVYPDSIVVANGEGGPALEARLCRPVDVAIHRDERRFALVENDCATRDGQLQGRLRLVDADGILQKVAALPVSQDGCQQAPTSIEWLPGGEDRVVIACGAIRVFSLDGQDLTALYFQGKSFQAMHSVRLAPHGELIASGRRSGDSFARLTALRLHGEPRELLSKSSSHERVGKDRWLPELVAEVIPSATYAPDGSLLLLAWQQGWSEVLAARPGCRPGQGLGAGGRCEDCPPGKFSDGARELYGRCIPCQGDLEDSDAGATRCGCRAGFKRVHGKCEMCQLGNYCPLGQENGQRCPGWGMTYNGSLPGNYEADSPTDCDCCFGQFRSGAVCESCPAGRWCGGSRDGFKETPFRLQNGYWLPKFASAMEESVTFKCLHPAQCWWTTYPKLWASFASTPCRLSAKLEGNNCSALHCASAMSHVDVQTETICPTGQGGLACSRCPAGTFHSGWRGKCWPCRNTGLQLAVATFGALLLMAGIWWLLEEACLTRQHAFYNLSSCLAVMLVFYEHMRVCHRLLGMSWPLSQEYAMDGIEQGVTVAMAYVLPFTPECLAPDSLAVRLASLVLVLPATALCSLLLFRLVSGALLVCSPKWDLGVNMNAIANALGLLTCVFCCPLTSSALSFFQCYRHPGSSGAWMSLRVSPDVLCSSDTSSTWQETLAPYAHLTAWQEALPVGVLGLLLPLSWLSQQVLLILTLPKSLVKNHGSERSLGFLARHRYSWRRLRNQYWDLVTIVRVLVLHLVVVLEPTGFPLWAQLYTVFLLSLLALLGVVVSMPYTELVVNILEGCSTAVLMLILTLGVLTIDSGELNPFAQRSINAVLGGAVCGFTGFVCLNAIRDFLQPVRAAKQELASTVDLVKEILAMAQAGCQMQVHVLMEVIEDLDVQSMQRAQRSLHYLEQMMMPSRSNSTSKDTGTRWTRLAVFEGRTDEVDRELESNFLEHGGVQAASISYKSSTAGISAVLADHSTSLMAEGGLVSPSRRSRPARRTSLLATGPAVAAEAAAVAARVWAGSPFASPKPSPNASPRPTPPHSNYASESGSIIPDDQKGPNNKKREGTGHSDDNTPSTGTEEEQPAAASPPRPAANLTLPIPTLGERTRSEQSLTGDILQMVERGFSIFNHTPANSNVTSPQEAAVPNPSTDNNISILVVPPELAQNAARDTNRASTPPDATQFSNEDTEECAVSAETPPRVETRATRQTRAFNSARL